MVIVESPAKARKIQQYLGSSAKVLATFGHVRDLAKGNSVDPSSGFELRWEAPAPAARRRLDELAELATSPRTGKVVLATDPDREGEAISWHVLEELRARGASLEEKDGGEFGAAVAAASSSSSSSSPAPATSKKRPNKSPKTNSIIPVERATFTSVTEAAVREALASPRAISRDLVEAYFARRALDRLFGFSLSPLLWRRLPGARSAGRVQSAALALVAARELEVRAFVPVDYFSVEAELETRGPPPVLLAARLKRQPHGRGAVPSPGLPAAALADAAVAALRDPTSDLRVSSVRSRPSRRSPPPPFATASLQQAASALLGMSPTDAMRAAQQLYEGGDEAGGEALITYHRTDGIGMPPEASSAVRDAAAELFGAGSVVAGAEPRQWKTRAKNAQEAHEAIRPTDPRRTPQSLSSASISPRLLRLYELVWRRTLASQMADARLETVTVDVGVTLGGGGGGGGAGAVADERDGGSLRATATVVVDPGFSLAYSPSMFRKKASAAAAASVDEEEEGEEGGEGEADGDDDEGTRKRKAPVGREGELPASAASAALLSSLKPGDPLSLHSAAATRHATRPPPRFSEAALVAAMEAAGVGRPATYAPTVRLLGERGYVVRGGDMQSPSSSSRALRPSPLGAVLAEYLRHNFGEYVDAAFTSGLEEALDDVAAGRSGWKSVLGGFWAPLEGKVEAASKISTREVIDELDASLGDAILRAEAKVRLARAGGEGGGEGAAAAAAARIASAPASEELDAAVAAARVCPSCGGRLGLKLASRMGGFFGCSGFPSCTRTRPLWVEEGGSGGGAGGGDGSGDDGDVSGDSQQQQQQSIDLGSHPDSGLPVSLRQGPYGPYVQLGEIPEMSAEERAAEAAEKGKGKARARGKGKRPTGGVRRVSLPRGLAASSVDLERALALLAFPRDLGPAPQPSSWPRPRGAEGEEGGGESSSGNTADAPVPSPGLSPPREGDEGSAAAAAVAAAADHGVVQVALGPYGYYVRLSGGGDGGEGGAPLSLSAPLPKETDPAGVRLEEAVALLAVRAARGPSSRGRGGRAPAAASAPAKKGAKEPRVKAAKGLEAAAAAASTTEAKKQKRPPTAYQLFCSSQRPTLPPKTSPSAAMTELAVRWRALGEAQRGPFEAAASAAKKERAAVAAPADLAGKAEAKAKRPPSAYILFCAAERASALASLPDGSRPASVLAELGSRWRGLGEDERGRFVAAAAAAAAAAAPAAAAAGGAE